MKNAIFAFSLAAATILSVWGATPALAAEAGASASSPLGTATLMTPSRGSQVGFVTSNGQAVYVFDLDRTIPGTSQCNDACAAHWPPIAPPATGTLSAPWGSITRRDGTKQLTYAGRPLYTYVADKSTTEAKGDLDNARGGIWHLAQAQPAAPAAATPAMPSGY
ncbi:MAG TPA: hypothetical protein VE591_13220 [Candidatus Acidoferrum sp.]|nr:hypothetical protein [Candidatus Acidoferrum sp.]